MNADTMDKLLTQLTGREAIPREEIVKILSGLAEYLERRDLSVSKELAKAAEAIAKLP